MTDTITTYLESNPYAKDADERTIAERIELGRSTNSHENQAIVPFPPIPANKWVRDILPYAERKKFERLWHTGVKFTEYLYRSEAGEVIQAVIRIDNADGSKDIMPLRYLGKAGWWTSAIEGMRPLYGLEKLALRPDAPVLIVEGEKTTEAAQALLPDYIVMTWPSGSSSTGRAEWLPLFGRDVTIWPDNDEAGHKAAKKVAAHVLRAGATAARIVPVPEELPAKWDLADQVPEQLQDRISIYSLLEKAAPVSLSDVEQLISDRSDHESLRVLGHKPGYSRVDIKEVEKALKHLEAGMTRLRWLRVGRCLYFAFGASGFSLFDEWSKGSPEKYKEGETEALWSSWKEEPHFRGPPIIWLLTNAGIAAKKKGVNAIVDLNAISTAEIEQLNDSHAVVMRGSKALVMRERFDPAFDRYEIDYLTKENFVGMHVRRIVVAEDDEQQGNRPKPRFPLGSYWYNSNRRRQYQNVYFAPGRRVGRDDLNLWQGFTVEPTDNPEGWSLFKAHIRENIAGGHQASYDYILNWMAFAVQRLDKRIGTALVLLGPKGVGKSMFTELFGYLFGRHKFVTAQSKDVLGNFNDRLEHTVLLGFDEAFVSQNLEAEGVLKDLITRETLRLEGKFLGVWDSPNFLRIVLTSNQERVVRADITERRYAVFNVTHPLERDPAARNDWFEKMIHQMKNGGYSAMLGELMNRDISQWHAEVIPETPALANQKKLEALDNPVISWYYDRLVNGIDITTSGPLVRDTFRWSQTEEVLVPVPTVRQDHEAHCKSHSFKYSANALSTKLKKLMPDGFASRTVRVSTIPDYVPPGGSASPAETVRVYPFPPLPVARAVFTERTGIPTEADGSEE